VLLPDCNEVRGVNDRVQLAQARRILNARILDGWMRAGVTVVDPRTTFIDVGVVLAADVEIEPGTHLEGSTVVETGARVGPGCLLRDTTVGRGAAVTHTVCVSAEIGPGATVAPFTYLPPGSRLGAQAPGRSAADSGRPRRKGAQQT
jgi:bifunctional UDP-N-acetylglucosamine pyrophosphorylase/glucosamine-1-phosphate N-acetyltransferase